VCRNVAPQPSGARFPLALFQPPTGPLHARYRTIAITRYSLNHICFVFVTYSVKTYETASRNPSKKRSRFQTHSLPPLSPPPSPLPPPPGLLPPIPNAPALDNVSKFRFLLPPDHEDSLIGREAKKKSEEAAQKHAALKARADRITQRVLGQDRRPLLVQIMDRMQKGPLSLLKACVDERKR
jgi:hypothetical protein